jgi:exonuclease SbcC
MKILNLYFKNINSLEGENRVQFDRAPLANCGVFAITGPNGSGKSSILDVISLGLYGETCRFDRPVEHVMTQSTAECFAQVEFELGTDKYRSSWQAKRQGGKPEGELLPVEMTLVQLNKGEDVLEDSTYDAREKIIQLVGMDFHTFTKSMVLAQGEFSAFLNALDSERMGVLEKISGPEIYDSQRKEAEEKSTEAQTVLKQLEQELNGIPEVDAVAREAGEHDLADFNEQLAEFNQEQESVEQYLDWFQAIADLEVQSGALVKQHEQEKARLEENNKTVEQIEATQSLVGLDTELAVVDEKTEVVAQSKKELQSFRHEIELLQGQLTSRDFDEASELPVITPAEQKNNMGEIQAKLSGLGADLSRENNFLHSLGQQLEDKQSSLQATETWLVDHAADEKLLTHFPDMDKLRELREELVDLSKKQKQYSKWAKSTTNEIKKKQSDIPALNKNIEQLKAQIEDDEKTLERVSDGRMLEELHELKVEQQNRVGDFQELLDLAGVNTKLDKKGFFSRLIKPKGARAEASELKKEAEMLQLKLGKEQNIVTVLEDALKNEALLKKMEPYRQSLVNGKACSLCGASEHPYEKHPPAVSNSKKVLAEQQRKVKQLLSDTKSLNKQITGAELQAEKETKKGSKLQLVRSQWRMLANKLNTADIEMDDLSLMKTLLTREKKELANIGQLVKKQVDLKDKIVQSKGAVEASEASLARVEEEFKALDSQWANRPKDSIEVEQLYTQRVEQEKELSEKIIQQLAELGEKMPAKRKEADFLTVLKNRQQEYQSQVTRQEPLAEEIKALGEKIKGNTEKVDKLNQEVSQHSDSMQKEELAGLHLALVEKQKLIVEKEAVFSQQSTELDGLKKGVMEQTQHVAEGNVPANVDALKEMITLAKSQPKIQQQQSDINQNISDVTAQVESVQRQLEAEKAKALTPFSEQELIELDKSIKGKIEIASQEINALQRKFEKQDDLTKKHQTVLGQVAKQTAIAAACEEDVNLQINENSLDFRHKIQQGLIDQLLSQSNQVLEKISGRYYLRKVDSEHGLAIEIEDTKQKNIRRLPKTLSGGESFVVSLALALGLADIANNGHAVDTLFLDEGFGNLDEESLYLVMTTLEGLKSHGKLVGVISHVEGVRKRIKTQIEMTKKPNGLSTLKVTP